MNVWVGARAHAETTWREKRTPSSWLGSPCRIASHRVRNMIHCGMLSCYAMLCHDIICYVDTSDVMLVFPPILSYPAPFPHLFFLLHFFSLFFPPHHLSSLFFTSFLLILSTSHLHPPTLNPLFTIHSYQLLFEMLPYG